MLRLLKIVFFFMVVSYPLSGVSLATDAATGKALFKAKGCTECHITERAQTSPPAATIDDLIATKGPQLWYAGDKFKKGFMEAWLQGPVPIRPMEYYSSSIENRGDHIILNKNDARDVSAYLTTLRSGKVGRGVISPKATIKGRVIFEKKLGCYGCHQMRKKDGSIVGGLSGPTLVGAGDRLSGDWVYAYLNDQKFFQSVFIMPVSKGLISDVDMRVLSAHIAAMP